MSMDLILFYSSFIHSQGTHGTGKTGKMEKNPCQGKHREFGNFAKTQGILFAQVINSQRPKVKDIGIFAVKISIFFRNWIGLPSLFCAYNSHKIWKLAQGKFAGGQGKHRENTGNLKIQFEWVP